MNRKDRIIENIFTLENAIGRFDVLCSNLLQFIDSVEDLLWTGKWSICAARHTGQTLHRLVRDDTIDEFAVFDGEQVMFVGNALQ